jgi:hypothetical protein
MIRNGIIVQQKKRLQFTDHLYLYLNYCAWNHDPEAAENYRKRERNHEVLRKRKAQIKTGEL